MTCDCLTKFDRNDAEGQARLRAVSGRAGAKMQMESLNQSGGRRRPSPALFAASVAVEQVCQSLADGFLRGAVKELHVAHVQHQVERIADTGGRSRVHAGDVGLVAGQHVEVDLAAQRLRDVHV